MIALVTQETVLFNDTVHYNISYGRPDATDEEIKEAARVANAIFSILAMRDGILPPTINLENPDPECDLDYVPGAARKAPIKTALSNSFGFGGTNGSLVFRAPR